MRLDVGPVAPSSAGVWIEWAHGVLGDHADRTAPATCPGPQMLETVDGYLRLWASRGRHQAFRWHVEVDPDELEYVAAALFHLDPRLSAAPAEGRDFHLALVRAVLRSLELEGPSRAAFADQLKWSWPSAVVCR